MATFGIARIETLTKTNYDTWKMHMEALLVKNDEWEYVNGTKVKPEVTPNNEASRRAEAEWIRSDDKAKSDIILSISASELKQVKGCTTSREVWLKLESIYQSRGPARKATLLKQLILQRMRDGEDVREHLQKFFDAVDKLSDMSVDINADLLAILLLYSLPSSFENFRCAIESRDILPTPEVLRVKIVEECDARGSTSGDTTNAMLIRKPMYKNRGGTKDETRGSYDKSDSKKTERYSFKSKMKCYKCHRFGHKAAECRRGDDGQQTAKSAENTLFFGSVDSRLNGVRESIRNALRAESGDREKSWCLDSGCSSHVCGNQDDFSNITETVSGKLNLANNSSTAIKARGIVSLRVRENAKMKKVDLQDTLFVPDLRTNLLSVGKIADRGYTIVFDKDTAKVLNRGGNSILTANRKGGLYYVDLDDAENCKASAESQGDSRDLIKWHRRLGHLNFKDLIEAARNGTYKELDIKKTLTKLECDVCPRGKMTRTPFPRKSNRRTTTLQLTHSDVCGPMRTESCGKAKYFFTLIDDHSRWCEVRFVKHKNDIFKEFVKVKSLLENQKDTKIKCLQSDNGTEYLNKEFNDYLDTHGIRRRLTVLHNPEQNGVAERCNRTLVETARCLLIQSGLPQSFWAEAVSAANYVRNRCPSRSLDGKTPYEVWHGEKPDIQHLTEFGSKVFILDKSSSKGKFDSRSKEGILLGYSECSKGYRVWIPKDRKVEVARDIKLIESSICDRKETSQSPITTRTPELELDTGRSEFDVPLTPPISETDQEDTTDEPSNTEEPQVTLKRNPGRPRKIMTGNRGRPRKEFNTIETISMAEEAFLAEIPLSQAVSSTDADEWYRSIAAELKGIIQNDTWDIVDRPKNQSVISSRIVLRNKYFPDGTLERRKARIVARGFTQRYGIDYNETFSPVARLSSIRLITALASEYEMVIEQVDVTTAYLNGILEETIYMELPEITEEILEFIIRTEPKKSTTCRRARDMLEALRTGDKVCLLKKALYGLRQAGRQWHSRLDQELKSLGAAQSKNDPCIYICGQGGDLIVIVIYVDDILLVSRNTSEISRFKAGLRKNFSIKEFGEAKRCLGLEFTRREKGYSIHQRGYIEEILARFGMENCKPVSTPIESGFKLSKEDVAKDRKLPYRELVGSLMYLAIATRPDIAHVVSWLSRFNDCYDESHWSAAKRVLRYLRGTSDLGISYERSSRSLIGYVDADWANCPEDRRSYTGFAFILANGAVTWESRKQQTVAFSSTEAEYMGISEATKEAIYLRRLLLELHFDDLANVTLLCDNVGAQKLVANPVFHSRTKHIDIRHHFVREAVKSHPIKLKYVPTGDMAADVLTKGLPGSKHRKCLSLLGLAPQLPHNEGEC